MKKRFNDTGSCNPHKHFMVDTSVKLQKTIKLIDQGSYFTINRPRQFGKTTTQYLLANILLKSNDYILIRLSFEGIGDSMFTNEENFCKEILSLFALRTTTHYPEISKYFEEKSHNCKNFKELSSIISEFVSLQQKKVCLLIDEVDKSSDNQLFLSFLGMLRNKYLLRNEGEDVTFQSVILAGVYDIKTIKLKLRPHDEQKYNSPWNIAVDYTVDLSFSAQEIESMLLDYSQTQNIGMDIPVISNRLFYYTNGYPYLVSKMCKVVDEILLPEKENQQSWNLEDIDNAFKYLTSEKYQTTLTDDLIKNLENNIELYKLVYKVSINGDSIRFNIDNPVMNLGAILGILNDKENFCSIHNRIFEQRIYNYMLSKSEDLVRDVQSVYIKSNQLVVENVLRRFQLFMKENYTTKDLHFIEREGRLIFLSFLKPIINGKGYDFKEPVVGDERRMDVVVTYNNHRDVIELKIWRGEEYHKAGLQQLSDYLDLYNLNKGYLLIFDFNKNKTYKEEWIQLNDKEIFAAWV